MSAVKMGDMKRKSLLWAVGLALLAAACIGLYIGSTPGSAAAVIYVDGEVYDRVELRSVVFPYEMVVETDYGTNTIRFTNHSVAVTEADCPGNDCVHQGEVASSLIPITCLPHHLVIKLEGVDE